MSVPETTLMDFVLPVLVSVVLPVLIVWIISRRKQNEANKRAEVLLKAIEAGIPIDAEALLPKKKSDSSIKMNLLGKLTGGCITSLIGLAFLILGIIKTMRIEFGNGILLNNMWLTGGAILLAVGIGLFISYFTGKKMMAAEIEAEGKRMGEQQ